MRKHIAAMLGLTLLMFIALPSAAQESISNFSGETMTGINLWVFSWDTVPGTQSINFQFKGGGISDVWVALSSFLTFEDDGKTKYQVVALNYQQDAPLYFRVRVTHSAGTTDWAQLQWGTDS
ncbi:MAG: hypothetical protein F4X87_02415 [Chloroflexi bacterium]|nr:hypothetical protein [Chloroflexota bacterium]